MVIRSDTRTTHDRCQGMPTFTPREDKSDLMPPRSCVKDRECPHYDGCGRVPDPLEPMLGDSVVACSRCWGTGHLSVLDAILYRLESIPCMSEDCDGPEDGAPVTSKNPPATRCHRCAAIRLGRSVLNGG